METIWVSNSWSRDIAGEKKIGLHFINAYRYLTGSAPLEYSDDLDGGTATYSGTVQKSVYENGVEVWKGITVTNSRCGAQALAETNSLSGRCTHGTESCTAGPLAGQGSGTRHSVIYHATNVIVYGENVGSGALGEGCLSVYEDSPLHLSPIWNPDFTKVGIGFGDMPHATHAELFAK